MTSQNPQRRQRCFAAIALFSIAGIATANSGNSADWSIVTQPVSDYLAGVPWVEGAGLIVVKDGELMHEQFWGDASAQSQVQIASATKMLSAVAILSLVDDGLIDLDAPVWTYLPIEFPAGTPKGQITVRQMFSHTSGLPAQSPLISDNTITLAEAVAAIGAATPLLAAPGTTFTYGGISMHVAGRVAEVVTGQSWATLFTERVATPLGLTATDYEAFGPTENPRIAGGARSSAHDLIRLAKMLANGGTLDDVSVLSPEAVAIMLSDQTGGAPPSPLPGSLAEWLGYGIGNWIEYRNAKTDAPEEFTSPGGAGTTPWVNSALGIAGVFVIQHNLPAVDGFTDAIRDFARALADGEPKPPNADLNDDGQVDGADLGILLSAWGTCTRCASDLNGDGVVDGADLGILLSFWIR